MLKQRLLKKNNKINNVVKFATVGFILILSNCSNNKTIKHEVLSKELLIEWDSNTRNSYNNTPYKNITYKYSALTKAAIRTREFVFSDEKIMNIIRKKKNCILNYVELIYDNGGVIIFLSFNDLCVAYEVIEKRDPIIGSKYFLEESAEKDSYQYYFSQKRGLDIMDIVFDNNHLSCLDSNRVSQTMDGGVGIISRITIKNSIIVDVKLLRLNYPDFW